MFCTLRKISSIILVVSGLAFTTSSCKPKSKYNIMSASSNPCIDNFMSKLQIDENMMTNPQLLNDILVNDMKLADYKGIQDFYASTDTLKKPESLRPLIDAIRTGINEKHPAVSEFLCAAVENNLIPKQDETSKALITRTIHHTLLLEDITHEMSINTDFTEGIRQHILNKRKEIGVRDSFIGSAIDIYKIYGSVFAPAKIKAMDVVMEGYKRDRERGSIPSEDQGSKKTELVVNIAEAITADYYMGYKNNAITGVALALNPQKIARIREPGHFFEYVLPQEWSSLYETWNLAFITGQISQLSLFYPKLIIPSVINAPANDYLFNRALSLWISTHFGLFSKAEKRVLPSLPNYEELSKLWGSINVKYAKDFVKKYNGHELKGVSDLFKIPAIEATHTTLRNIKNFFGCKGEIPTHTPSEICNAQVEIER